MPPLKQLKVAQRLFVTKIDAAEKLARELCERDGFVWELTYKPEPNTPQRLVNDEQRLEYMQRARAELRKDAGLT